MTRKNNLNLAVGILLPLTVFSGQINSTKNSCDASTCQVMVQWCLIKGGPEEIGKLRSKEDDNCRNCYPEIEKKIHGGKCPCCEVNINIHRRWIAIQMEFFPSFS